MLSRIIIELAHYQNSAIQMVRNDTGLLLSHRICSTNVFKNAGKRGRDALTHIGPIRECRPHHMRGIKEFLCKLKWRNSEKQSWCAVYIAFYLRRIGGIAVQTTSHMD